MLLKIYPSYCAYFYYIKGISPEKGEIKTLGITPYMHSAEYDPKLNPHKTVFLKSYPNFTTHAKTVLISD